MEKAKKQEFTARVVQANRSELIVIMYDLMFTYMEDATQHYKEEQWDKVKLDLSYTEDVLRRLQKDLNHQYEISAQLYALYQFSLNQLAMCKVKKDLEGMENAKRILTNLYVGMKGMAKEDTSAPLMRNSQKVVAGLTYGKNSMNEITMEDAKRGFYA